MALERRVAAPADAPGGRREGPRRHDPVGFSVTAAQGRGRGCRLAAVLSFVQTERPESPGFAGSGHGGAGLQAPRGRPEAPAFARPQGPLAKGAGAHFPHVFRHEDLKKLKSRREATEKRLKGKNTKPRTNTHIYYVTSEGSTPATRTSPPGTRFDTRASTHAHALFDTRACALRHTRMRSPSTVAGALQRRLDSGRTSPFPPGLRKALWELCEPEVRRGGSGLPRLWAGRHSDGVKQRHVASFLSMLAPLPWPK
ncbi:Hypothetical predicted protein [Marmota monax]|uniref:Uncharacterized protein n=1 Tax=Marmota monax TaxID=9995 RepID=A0A5E4BTU1_MARMO|nr:Hypothetical predicted protein [Marmota monax]